MKKISLQFHNNFPASSFQSLKKTLPNWRFLDLLKQDLNPVIDFANQQKNKFENIVILGIGGSALGGKALFRALKTPYWNNLNDKLRNNFPRLFFLDSIDPDQTFNLFNSINPAKTLFIVISKSGNTTEPLSLFLYVLNIFKKTHPSLVQKNIVVITANSKSSLLKKIAQKEQIATFHTPEEIGGRFSVLSPVGLLPAALIGIDIKKIIFGAKDLLLDEANNLAEWQYYFNFKKKKNITVFFPYSYHLEALADWYEQLLAESLGKNGLGPTPLKAGGPRDQHSLVQLFVDGPDDKIYLFIQVENFKNIVKLKTAELDPSFSYLRDITLNKLFNSELKGTLEALKQKKRPCALLAIPEINEYYMGQLLTLFEMQIALLGNLYKVNVFNQPGVELGKKLTKKYCLE